MVEPDWPEYDLVWDMIESHDARARTARKMIPLIEDIKLCMDMADGGEDSDSEEAAFFASILARIRRLKGRRSSSRKNSRCRCRRAARTIQKMLTQLMDIAVSNGANSVSDA